MNELDLPADKALWPARLPGETPKSYAAFRVYRDMGLARTQQRTALAVYDLDPEEVTPGVLAVKCRQIAEWSRLNAWVVRAEEYDRQVDGLAMADAAADLGRMREKHALAGQRLINLGLDALEHVKPESIKPALARMLIATGAQVEARARQVDEVLRIRHEGSIDHGDPVGMLREMLAITDEAGTAQVWGDDEGTD